MPSKYAVFYGFPYYRIESLLPAQSNQRSSSPCSMMTNIVGVTESTATILPSLVIARPATISMYLIAIFRTKWPCLVKICILLLSLPRSQTTNFPLVFITATFLGKTIYIIVKMSNNDWFMYFTSSVSKNRIKWLIVYSTIG